MDEKDAKAMASFWAIALTCFAIALLYFTGLEPSTIWYAGLIIWLAYYIHLQNIIAFWFGLIFTAGVAGYFLKLNGYGAIPTFIIVYALYSLWCSKEFYK